jgi:hypothetical protein
MGTGFSVFSESGDWATARFSVKDKTANLKRRNETRQPGIVLGPRREPDCFHQYNKTNSTQAFAGIVFERGRQGNITEVTFVSTSEGIGPFSLLALTKCRPLRLTG